VLNYAASSQGGDFRDKIKLSDFHSSLIVNIKIIIGAIAVVVLFFFGIIFALASVYAPTRLIVAALLFVVGFGIVYYISRKPKTIVQKLEVSGEMKAVSLKCPNCGASVDAKQIKIVSGVPYATCPYCGHSFEVAEEPKW
jgi:DNA-directed RNA polymerase subunit RPC12/RpoP